jgi:hypothetical protein
MGKSIGREAVRNNIVREHTKICPEKDKAIKKEDKITRK